jgi:hypothetical protein
MRLRLFQSFVHNPRRSVAHARHVMRVFLQGEGYAAMAKLETDRFWINPLHQEQAAARMARRSVKVCVWQTGTLQQRLEGPHYQMRRIDRTADRVREYQGVIFYRETDGHLACPVKLEGVCDLRGERDYAAALRRLGRVEGLPAPSGDKSPTNTHYAGV